MEKSKEFALPKKKLRLTVKEGFKKFKNALFNRTHINITTDMLTQESTNLIRRTLILKIIKVFILRELHSSFTTIRFDSNSRKIKRSRI